MAFLKFEISSPEKISSVSPIFSQKIVPTLVMRHNTTQLLYESYCNESFSNIGASTDEAMKLWRKTRNIIKQLEADPTREK